MLEEMDSVIKCKKMYNIGWKSGLLSAELDTIDGLLCFQQIPKYVLVVLN